MKQSAEGNLRQLSLSSAKQSITLCVFIKGIGDRVFYLLIQPNSTWTLLDLEKKKLSPRIPPSPFLSV
jgi:hypothetical protein